MRLRNTLILFIVAVLLVGYFLLVEQPRHERTEIAEAERWDLTPVSLEDVRYVFIESRSTKLSFVRVAEGWRMTSPLSDAANNTAVNTLVRETANAQLARNLGPEPDLSTYGLDDPAVVLTLAAAPEETLLVLHVGDFTVDKASVYARRLPSDDVLLIPTGIRRYSLLDPSEFRNKRVVDFDLDNVEWFTVEAAARSTTWRRTLENEWTTANEGVTIAGRKTDVEGMLRRLRGLRVTAFVAAEELSGCGPRDGSTGTIRVVMAPGDSSWALFVGERQGDGICVRLSTEDRVVVTDTTLLKVFDETVFDLRNRRMVEFDREAVSKVTFEAPEFDVTLVRPGHEWGFPNPALGKLDQKEIKDLLVAIQKIEFESVVFEDTGKAPRFDLSKSDITITIFDDAGREVDKLVCRPSETKEGAYTATSRSSNLVAELAGDAVTDLVERFKNLRRP